MLSEFGTSVEVVCGRTDSRLVGFGILSSWLQVSGKCARLECMRVPFVKGKQRFRVRERGMIPPNQNNREVESKPAHMLSSLCQSDLVILLL